MTDGASPNPPEIAPPPHQGSGVVQFVCDPVCNELRQGEILTELIQYEHDPAVGPTGATTLFKHPYAVVVSQDCDLLREFQKTLGETGILNGVLLLEAELALSVKARMGLGTKEFKVVRQNNNERFHFLPAVPIAHDRIRAGLPELVIDFRRFFTMPPREIYRQCAAEPIRRCRLEMPFREQLQNRFAFYLSRVALPEADET